VTLGGFGSFLGVSALVILTPGQDTALVIRNALTGGRRAGLLTTLGVVAGQAVWTLASGTGLTALLMASKPVFAWVRVAGAAYLLFLGARSQIYALFPRPVHEGDAADARKPESPGIAEAHDATSSSTRANAAPTASPRPGPAFRQGLLSALGNAKLAVFFVSLFPQFVPRGHDSGPALAVLGLTFCTMTLAWLSAYAAVVGKTGDWLGRRAARRVLEAVLGAALVAFGLRVATEHR
jgi:threonine/homoserine/homoserine lactone efflux protein